jgi:phosphinothricin acetyltransferase
MHIRPADSADAPAIAAIYNPYITDSCITFEEVPVTPADITERMQQVQQQGLPYLVACRDGQVMGYCYATPWRVRSAYRFSVEVTVYLAGDAHGQGIGTALYQALLAQLTAAGYHLAIGGITLPNDKSVALHEKLGFSQVAHFSEVGFKQGAWRDVGYWQRKLGE